MHPATNDKPAVPMTSPPKSAPMQVQDLAIPDTLRQQYLGLGIRELYPPQAACVEKGLLDGKNLLVAIPTAEREDASMQRWRCTGTIAAGGKCPLYCPP